MVIQRTGGIGEKHMVETGCIMDVPESVGDVLKLITGSRGYAKLIAGGTDLLVDIKSGALCPDHLVSLSHVKELKEIREMKGNLSIGAMTTANEIVKNRLVNKWLPALSDAAFSMASYQIRNMATIGGNLCSAVPSADLAPPLIAAEASIALKSGRSERLVPLEKFFTGPRKTVMKQDELATRIVIPKQPLKSGSSYKKFKIREANALAAAGVAARLVIEKGKLKDARLVLGAVAPIPMLSPDAMKLLRGKVPSHDVFEEAAGMTFAECKPISDVRCCADFRRQIVKVLTVRALDESLQRAGGA